MEIVDNGQSRQMYQKEWQHFADYENIDQDWQNVPTPTLKCYNVKNLPVQK